MSNASTATDPYVFRMLGTNAASPVLASAFQFTPKPPAAPPPPWVVQAYAAGVLTPQPEGLVLRDALGKRHIALGEWLVRFPHPELRLVLGDHEFRSQFAPVQA
jgi:hypothetical protein